MNLSIATWGNDRTPSGEKLMMYLIRISILKKYKKRADAKEIVAKTRIIFLTNDISKFYKRLN